MSRRYVAVEDACAEVDKGGLLVGNNAEWAKEIIRRTHNADVVEVVHAEWIENRSAIGRYFTCSNCGKDENHHTAIKGRYCWSCGAKMDGGTV